MHPDKMAAYAVALCYLPLAVVAVANAVNTIAVRGRSCGDGGVVGL